MRVSILALHLTVFSVWSLEKRFAVCLCFVQVTAFVCLFVSLPDEDWHKYFRKRGSARRKYVMAVESCVMMNCVILFPVLRSSGAVVVRRPELAGNGERMREKALEYTLLVWKTSAKGSTWKNKI